MSFSTILDWIRERKGFVAACAAALVVVAGAAVWYGTGAGDKPSTSIDIRASYLPSGEGELVDVQQSVAYRNDAGSPLAELVFHLYPLAYSTQETAPVSAQELDAAYPNGFQAGGVQALDVLVKGEIAEIRIEGTAVRIPLRDALREGDSVDVELAYTLSLPDCRARFGAGGHSVNLLNAFAIPAVYGETGWRMDAYGPIGDPFVSESADYRASIEAPQGYVVAATGELTSQKTRDGRTSSVFEAKGAREFAAVLSQDYVTAQTNVGGVQVLSRAPTQAGADRALAYAAQAVEAMDVAFGDCAYKEVEVCSADLLSGGMEYPGLAVIDVGLYEEGSESALEYCVAHEVAHQWWYGGVGSDQVNHPWMDESLAEYSTLLIYESAYGPEGLQSAYRQFVRPRLLRKGLASVPVGRPITSFSDNDEYASVIYAKGAAMWHALRQDMGDEAFFSSLRGYYEDNVGTIAGKQDLYDALGGDAAAQIESWLTGKAP